MNVITCPLCGTVIMTSAGIRENAVDLWFNLNDGSMMKFRICSNCLVTFDTDKAQAIFAALTAGWGENFASLDWISVASFDNIIVTK